MKKLKLTSAHKLSREEQKKIAGSGKELCPHTGCFYDYLSNGQGGCLVPPCGVEYGLGSEVFASGRWQCCF